MSLIEQAAKRLEELRRAGAETAPDAGGEPDAAADGRGATAEHLATPEAAVRELNARGNVFVARNAPDAEPTPVRRPRQLAPDDRDDGSPAADRPRARCAAAAS